MATTSRLNLRSTPAPKELRRPLTPAAPIVKWAGGKTRILDHLLTRRPLDYRRYYEPFLGGGAVFFRMRPHRAVIGDLNRDLMNVYRCVAWNVEAVIKRLEDHGRKHGHDHYYATRERLNDRVNCTSDVERAAAFLYLNKTCYNGLYRVNQKGQFNVPIGRYQNPRICAAEELRSAARSLRRAELRVGHFANTLEDVGPGDFVYLDPPYDPITKTANFTSYTASDFRDVEQHELARVVADLTDRGAFVMVSNSDTPYIRELYRGFKIDKILAPRAINSCAAARGPVAELVITNGYLL